MSSESNAEVIQLSRSGISFPRHKIPARVWGVVKQTYTLRSDSGQPCETPEQMFRRVVDFVCTDLEAGDVEDIYKLMCAGVFYPNVVFFMNAATPVKNLGACYMLEIKDSLQSIMNTLHLAVDIASAGGGVGINFSDLRRAGDLVHSNKGGACGPVAVMRMFNAATDMIKAGGRRRGANIMILSCDHPDVEEFIRAKDEPGELENANLSVLVTDWFMKQATQDETSRPALLLNLIAHQAHKTGDPGLLFYERLNKDSAFEEPIITTNPCGEVCLPAPAACNLASIDVSKFYTKDAGINIEWFKTVVEFGCLFLSAALDRGHYVSEDIQSRMAANRPVGLGIMGFADLLLKCRMRYGSEKSLALARLIGGAMRRVAADMLPRSCTRLAFAPTGTLSAMAGCSCGIEPVFAWKSRRKVETTGEVLEVTHPLDRPYGEADRLPDYFVTAHEVSPGEHVDVQAAFQENVDGGVSKTVNLQRGVSKDVVREVFVKAWVRECKGVTVFRDGCKGEQIITVADVAPVARPSRAGRRELPRTRPSVTHHFQVGEFDGYLTVGLYDDGTPAETFIASKEGSTLGGMLDAFAIAISFCLQYSVPLEDLVKVFKGHRFEPLGATWDKGVPFAKSIPDYMFRWLAERFLPGNESPTNHPNPVGELTGDACPLCGSPLRHSGGCDYCECGYSTCS